MILLADLEPPSSSRRSPAGKAAFRKTRRATKSTVTAGEKAKLLVPPKDMYGKTTVIIGTNLPTLGFAGMYWHQASGLYLTSIGNTYDANTGRWLGRDLLGEDASLNLYQYCFDDPVDWTDPLGLACEKEATELLAAQYGLKVADNALAEAQKFLNSIQSQASKRVLFDILMQQAKDKFAIAHSNRNRAYARLQSALDALRECWKKNPPGGGTPCPAPAPAPTPAPATPAPAPATNTPPADPTVPNRFPDQTIPANRPPAYRPAPFAPAPIFRPIPVF